MSDGYDGPGSNAELSLLRSDDVFYLLSHHRKRAVVLLLAMAPHGRIHLDQLAETLCCLESDCTSRYVDRRDITTLRTNLNRSHIDPLVDAGVISPGESTDVYVPGPAFSVGLITLLYGGYSLQ